MTDGFDDAHDLPAVPESVRIARTLARDAATAAGLTAERIDAVALAVTEACANVVVHAYPQADVDRRFWILTTPTDVGLRVTVRDRGCGIARSCGPQGLGAGLPLMAELSDGVEYLDREGTTVAMDFRAS